MANFSQLRRRQSSREILFRHQFHEDFEGRARHHSVSGRPTPHFQRQLSETPEHDELASLMWEMRPRYATSAGELKRKHKRDRMRRESGQRHESGDKNESGPPPAPKKTHLDTIKDEVEPPSRVSSTHSFVQPPDPEGGETREAWDSKITFILATIGYAVGLGNVWRFPYLAQKNGGGAFLIPYWIMLFAEGLPIFLLELAIGQRLRKGSIGAWKQMSPYLGGIGIASGVVSFNVALYYNTIIAWCLNYFVRSFQFPLPWSVCPPFNSSFAEETAANSSNFIPVEECGLSSPTQYFWYRETLNISDDIENPNNFNWIICLCLVASWLLVYLCMVKGITENPSVIYVTAIYPYVVLIIFFVRGLTLEGMEDGVLHFFTPRWERLADPLVWLEAGTQIFFSLGLAFGGLIAYSSYNPVNNNCTRDALLVAFTNCCTSMFAGVVIFSIMGFKANVVHKECLALQNSTLLEYFQTTDIVVPEDGFVLYTTPEGELLNKSVPFCSLKKELDNSASGTGLAFILFTEAVNQFPFGNLWAIMFFLMLFTLGLDSQFGTLQGVIQCVIDLKLMPNVRKEVLTGVICGACLIISMVFSHGSGNYIFTLFDNFAGSIPLLVIALMECIAVAYVYGIKRFCDDIELMTGNRPNIYWMICWKYVSPIAMTLILAASLLDMAINGSGYEAWDSVSGLKTMKSWPIWAQVLALILISLSILWIPIVALLKCCGISLLKPEPAGWFPAEELKSFYQIEDYKPSKVEKALFGMRDDGSEGLCFPTMPHDHVAPPARPKIKTGGDDEEITM